MTADRTCIITIDSLVRLLKDYLGEENIPADAMPVKLMRNTREANKIGIMLQSDSFTSDVPLMVYFDLKRVYNVG